MAKLDRLSKTLNGLGFIKESQAVSGLILGAEDFKNFTPSTLSTMSFNDKTALAKKIFKESDPNQTYDYADNDRLIKLLTECLNKNYGKAAIFLFLLNPGIRSNQELDKAKVIPSKVIKSSLTYNANLIRIARTVQKYFQQIGTNLFDAYNKMILAAQLGLDIDGATGASMGPKTTEKNLLDDGSFEKEVKVLDGKINEMLSSL